MDKASRKRPRMNHVALYDVYVTYTVSNTGKVRHVSTVNYTGSGITPATTKSRCNTGNPGEEQRQYISEGCNIQ